MKIAPALNESISQYHGFTVSPYPANPRLQVVTLEKNTLDRFIDLSANWELQALEYKPFLRYAVADALDKACDYQLGKFLVATMANRETGAFLLQADELAQAAYEDTDEQRDFFVKLSTAVSHLIGIPNFDAMYGKYYARFTVKNEDSSDSYLRQAHRRMELHNDGTYVNERTDFVLMMKMDEKNMEMGDSLLLHVDEWQDLERFYHHPMAKQNIVWGAPPSKNVGYTIEHPVFFEEDSNGKPHMLFIDQFAQPQNMQQGLYLHQMSESLETDTNCFNVRVKVGAMLVVQNHCWLHGRDKFVAHAGLKRELLRQRGHFTR
ncbi:glutarate dioxygenase GlaH [Photobacterium alginatilyticum]|uniref:Carbon starvation induced protein CsiD n=1 Tax=Photobacterium alginatilyticum TaxID=1775171 RepID=A0ABW9YFU6_9GAMM|nr:glutarate dioxygenase GlaH [Photobacterium alginatilyticum]NBI52466.1 carbon starvation induced protein CsiD [Photobacterium alginatilyticum]